MLIAQISDTHISVRGKKTYGVAPMDENLTLCIAHINQCLPKPDLVLVTGDISSSGSLDELEYAAELLSQLEMPFFVISGNHDDRLNLLSAFNHENCPLSTGDNGAFINYVIDDYAIRLIAVDSTITKQSGGEICEQRAGWLDQQLSKNTHKPTIIFMHHPPIKLSVIETDIDGFIGKDRLARVVKKYQNIERILCGHVHLSTFARWNGTIVSTAPSIGMQLLLDLTMTLESQFLLEPPAYQLHHWTADKDLISHTVSVKPNQQVYLFEE